MKNSELIYKCVDYITDIATGSEYDTHNMLLEYFMEKNRLKASFKDSLISNIKYAINISKDLKNDAPDDEQNDFEQQIEYGRILLKKLQNS